jgi:histidinol phosphatase-like PHP family hydrolase
MMWLPVDCHAHSIMSDGALDVPQIVARAAERGVRPSVSDHISLEVSRAIQSVEDVRLYLDTLDLYPVLRGGEFCWHDALWRQIPVDLARRFTHRIGSLHAIWLPDGRLVHAFARRLPEGLTPEIYMTAHLANLESFAREMPVDILAHPTLVPLPFRTLPIEELWTEPRQERAVRALAAAGVAFEISNRYRPPERFVQRAVAAGVRIALGSDGHTAQQVANVVYPLSLARASGVHDEDLYDPAAHGSRVAELPRPAA